MADLLLVHGAWHGAWCWDELIPELEARGHSARAVDLPGMGQDETPAAEASLAAYAGRVAEAVKAAAGKVWLVGHSMGGASITQAGEWAADRLAGIVYVTAGLPLNGQAFFDAVAPSEPTRLQQVLVMDQAAGAGRVPPEHLKACFYHLCSDAQVERARRLLREWQPFAPAATPVVVTEANYGRVPRYYVECLQDEGIPIAVQRRMHKAAGVREVATLDTDHSPFFSCPGELAAAIDGFTLRPPG